MSQCHNVVRYHNFIAINNVIPAKGGNPGKGTVHGETISEMGKSLEDKMDGVRRSRAERPSWRNLRSDWIPAFETVS
jgi:hypothetical protein